MTLPKTILKSLLFNEEYSRKVLPFLKPDYFSEHQDKILFNEIGNFILKYNQPPTLETLEIEIDNLAGVKDETVQECREVIKMLARPLDEKTNEQWLIDETEKFCQEKAIYLAMMESIEIMNNKSGSQTKGAIPKILSDALAISFDPHVGHDYLEDFEERFDFYHNVEEKIPFDLEFFNKITKEGVAKKSLNIILAGTGVGKTLIMCHFAASYLAQGKNVLYITMEMAEEKIAERIDANLLNVSLDDLAKLPKDLFEKKINLFKKKTTGKLIIKEFPTASANSLHFKALLNELYLKKNFKPDVIFIDYLNICSSSRMKMGGSVNTYSYIKSIAEELRGLAVEFKVPIWSATQTNRTGFVSSDVGLEDTSESFGLPATADFMIAAISNEELEKLNQLLIKQLKNRYNSIVINKKFTVGVDRDKMRLYDVEQSAQANISESGQDNSDQKDMSKAKWLKQDTTKKKFGGIKV